MRAAPTLVVALGMSLSRTFVSAGSAPILTVRVYNYAGVSDKTLSTAELTAARILGRAGIKTHWIGCPKDRDEEYRYPDCQKPGSAADVILHIVPQSMEGYDVRQTAFGFALASGDARPSKQAYVFCRRVEDAVQKSGKVTLATLLAYVMLHETGHLLLGPGMHVDRGIMRQHWQPEDLREMERGGLVFTADQARAMQVRVQQRAKRDTGGY